MGGCVGWVGGWVWGSVCLMEEQLYSFYQSPSFLLQFSVASSIAVCELRWLGHQAH